MQLRSVVVLLLCATASHTVTAVTKTDGGRTVSGVVFEDGDGNGRRGRWERGIQGVAVSNGREVVRTDAVGGYNLQLAPGQTLFVVKPAGWRFGIEDPARPRYWLHAPPVPAVKLKYGGLPRNPSTARFDLGLQREPDNASGRQTPLEVRIFGDPQVKSRMDVGYYARDIVDGVIAERRRIDLGISLGDIVNDDLSLYPAINAETWRIGVPWLHVAGNHDLDFDAMRDEDSLLTFRSTYGPDTFAWEEGSAVFIGLDDVIYNPGAKPEYIGGFREDQLAFLESYLQGVAKDRLLVLAMHIPLFESDGRDTFRDADRNKLFALLQPFSKVLILSAHSHAQRHWLHDAKAGWNGALPLHEYNVGAACGAFWSGVKDARGIPDATMDDGTPNGYASLLISRSGQYALAWHPAPMRDGEHPAIGLHAPKVLRRNAYPAYGVYANVYMGRDDTQVEYRIDGGPWRAMTKILRADPRLLAENDRDDSAMMLRGYDRSPEAKPSPHLWRGALPTDLTLGTHRIEVRAFDAWQGEQRAQTEYRLDEAKE